MDSYKVGLHNVGSYRVSGRPWLKTLTLNPGESASILFPSVVSGLIASTDSDVDVVKLGFLNPDSFESSKAIDMADNSSTYYESDSYGGMDASGGISISFWFKPLSSSGDQRLLQYNNTNFRLQTRESISQLRLVLPGPITKDSGVEYIKDAWNHVVVTFKNNQSVVYTNGEKGATETTYSSILNLSNVFFGSTGASYQDDLDDALVINRSVTDEEVLELYNGGSLIDPTQLSFYSDVISYWAFDDTLSPPDTLNQIEDRKSNYDLFLTQASTPAPSFIDRTNIPMSNLLSLKKSYTTMNCKTKRLFVKALTTNTGPVNVSIFASLTNIPSQRMYELTGPGIDE